MHFSDMPFQVVPVLEVDGSAKVCGHVNIARYIGEKYSELLSQNNYNCYCTTTLWMHAYSMICKEQLNCIEQFACIKCLSLVKQAEKFLCLIFGGYCMFSPYS